MIKEKYNLFIKDNKKQIRQLILLHKYEEALSKIANMANMLYESNQYYVDNDSENALLNIQRQLQKKYDFEEIKDVNTKTVLFYDGFGLDSRGLAYIYLKALVNLGYKVIYMTISNAQGNIPRITKLIEDAGGEIVFCRTDSYTLWYQYTRYFLLPSQQRLFSIPHHMMYLRLWPLITLQVKWKDIR